MKTGLVPEYTLEAMVRERIAWVKERYPCWRDPEQLCDALGIRVEYGSIGLGSEGAALADAIKLDSTAGVPARRNFTFYHEIVHHLVRAYDELYSIIHDQYETEPLLDAIQERLANVGAAEFLLPRGVVQAAYAEQGFSVALIEQFSQPGIVSRVAVCAQLVYCTSHACIGVVCRRIPTSATPSTLVPTVTSSSSLRTVVDVAFSSSTMKYSCASGTVLPGNHFLTQMFTAAPGERLVQPAPIPFKSGRQWSVECEAVRLGEQVFAFFHQNAPPTGVRNQLQLPW